MLISFDPLNVTFIFLVCFEFASNSWLTLEMEISMLHAMENS